MARGYPDYSSNVGRTAEGLFLTQVAKPAIWFEDNFNSPICKWSVNNGTGEIYTSAMLEGGTCQTYDGEGFMAIKSTVASSEVAALFDVGAFPANFNVGIALRFNTQSGSNYFNAENGFVPFYLEWTDGTYNNIIYVCCNTRNGKWYVSEDGGSTFKEIGTAVPSDTTWQYAKLIFDPVNEKLVRLIVNNTSFDLTNYSWSKTADTGSLYCTAAISFINDTLFTEDLAVDSYVITYGES